MRLLFCWIVLIAALDPAVTGAPPSLRLPANSRPVESRIDLQLDPAREAYSGRVEIDIRVLQPSREIWLNTEGLDVKRAEIRRGARKIEARILTQPHDFTGFQFTPELSPGEMTLHVEFTGRLEDRNSNGLFRMQEAGDWYAFTQFEPIAARAAFPCYDEPGFKVPWTLTLRVPQALKAVANTPLISETAGADGLKTFQFAKSKPMPSYLVAFAVGPFEFVDAGVAGKKKTPLRIITPRGKAHEARYAVEITGRVLEEMEAYFGIPYPYEKLDSIALPLTFGFGAMENAGLITYARTLLLCPPDREADSFRRDYLSVAAHEIAHQWFGNLVTPEYWDDIWLNEAFATWLENKITHRMRPEWKRDLSAIEEKAGAMAEDGLATARRIRQPIRDSGDIVNAFDGITYTKGAAVIAMFEQWLGEKEFQAGVRRYMQRYAWRNATAGMFLDSISAAGGKSVSAAFSTFLNQPGVPLLTAALKCDGQPAVELTQQRLLPIGSQGSVSQSWQLPVCLAYENQTGIAPECHMISSPSQEVRLAARSCPAWFNANAGAAGYYRVAYQDGMLARLASSGRLSAGEKIDLLRNARALAGAGKLPMADAAQLARLFATEGDWRVAGQSAQLLAELEDLTLPSVQSEYRNLVLSLFGERARRLGWQAQAGAERAREQEELVPFVALSGDDRPLRSEALQLARKWLENRSSVPLDLVTAAMGVAARTGGEAFFEEVKAALARTADRSERRVLIGALGKSGDPALVRRALAMLPSRELDVREGGILLFAPSEVPVTRSVPYEFVRDNYEALMQVAPTGGSFNFGAFLPAVANGLCDEKLAREAQAFFESKLQGVTGASRAIATMVEVNSLCVARRQALQPELARVLSR